MKPISEQRMENFESLADEGANMVRAYFRSDKPGHDSYQMARLGVTTISGFARIRASETAREILEARLTQQKVLPAPKAKKPKKH